MRLERQTIFLLDGIATLPAATVPIVTRMRQQLPPVGVTGRLPGLITAALTKNVDGDGLLSDRRVAVANLILSGGLAQVHQAERVREALEAVRERRRRQHPDGIFLITEVSRSIRAPARQPALGVVNAKEFDLIVEGPRIAALIDFQRQAHEAEMTLIGSLRMTANDHLQHHELHSATYLLQGNKRPEYRLWFEAGSADFRMSLNVTDQSAQRMRGDVRRLLRRPEASRSLGLVGRVSSSGEDSTVEFLVSFTGLEQYVKDQVPSGNLVSRFAHLASQRYSTAEAAGDIAEFRTLYDVRNNLAHEGQRVGDRSLAQRVRTLLIRYLA